MIEIAALLACVLLTGLAIFQLALIFGAPIGRFAWGGSQHILPARLRIASAFSILLYLFFAFVILAEAGVLSAAENSKFIDTTMWILTVYFFTGIVMNAVSRSKSERLVMTPMAAALALLFLYVSLTA